MTNEDCINSHLNPFMNLKDTLWETLWMGMKNVMDESFKKTLKMEFNCLKASVPLRGDSLFFTSKSLGVNRNRSIYLRRMKG